ncbi:hypothetical protein AMECASPLE_023594 [Ameca splendens]|uniref:Uncharacterized protein n=1 Tax=Ameca splendens TaxID=208324 RepID=A0ABV0XT11_9TELE
MKRTEFPLSAQNKIFQSARRFYGAVLQKMLSSFPLDHPLLRDMKVLESAHLNITPGTGMSTAFQQRILELGRGGGTARSWCREMSLIFKSKT